MNRLGGAAIKSIRKRFKDYLSFNETWTQQGALDKLDEAILDYLIELLDRMDKEGPPSGA